MNKIKYILFLCFVFSFLLMKNSYAEEINLAKDCIVKASSFSGKSFLEYVVDGNREGQFWMAEHPCWLEIDLGEIMEITKIHLFMWWGDNRYYQYYIEVSPDGKDWKEVADERASTQPPCPEGRIYAFPETTARFVRFNGTYCSIRASSHVREIEVYGK